MSKYDNMPGSVYVNIPVWLIDADWTETAIYRAFRAETSFSAVSVDTSDGFVTFWFDEPVYTGPVMAEAANLGEFLQARHAYDEAGGFVPDSGHFSPEQIRECLAVAPPEE